jgi:hypothetical protein
MATQDFADGGYIGKLGETVGQRWHNKRYVRRYVKTPNPNTPDQIANRTRFANSSRMANYALQFFKGNGWYDTTLKSEFTLRIGQAVIMLRDNKDLDKVGLICPPYSGPDMGMFFENGHIGPGATQYAEITYDVAPVQLALDCYLCFLLQRQRLLIQKATTCNVSNVSAYVVWPDFPEAYQQGEYMIFFVGSPYPAPSGPVYYTQALFNDEI